MLQVAFSQLKTHSRRFIAIMLAVLLAVAFLSATLMVNSSATASLTASLGQSYAKADLVASATASVPLTAASAAAAARTPGVAASYPLRQEMVPVSAGTATLAGVLRNLPASPALEPLALVSGSWPTAAGQVTVDAKTAAARHLAVGSTVTLGGTPVAAAHQEGRLKAEARASGSGVSGSGTSGAARSAEPDSALPAASHAVKATVTGVMAASADPQLSGLAQFAATAATLDAVSGPDTHYTTIAVKLVPGTNTATATTALEQALRLPAGQVVTPQELTTATVKSFTGGTDHLTIVLLAFAAVALLVSGLVVSNTFSVLVAQRTRELALLRCVGASRKQVRSSVILEALVVGLAASVLGVLAAVGTMAVVVGLLRHNPDYAFATLGVPASSIIAGLVVGTLLTVAASLVPARSATRVAPLAALRPADDASVHNAAGRVRLGIGIALILVGGAGLVAGGLGSNLLLAVPAGAASFVGLILAATLFVPRLVSMAGRLARPAGVPGTMASANAVRNPRRTTATASALLIGVTLVTMMMTGAATARQAFESQLADHFPVDMAAAAVPGAPAFTGAELAKAATLPGVEAVAQLKVVGTVTAGGRQYPAYGISAADAARLLGNPANRPAPGTVVLPKGTKAAGASLVDGKTTTRLTVHTSTTGGIAALVPLSDFPAAAAGSPVLAGAADQVWIKVSPSLDGTAITALRADIASALHVDENQVDGAVLEKVMFNQVINTLLLVVTGLLAVAIVIALIGVANTLSLSVLERTRENSLLRALGLTRGQLRGMLALEAVLIAGVAAVIGSVLGVVYGWLGAQSALGSFTTVVPVVPWAQVLLVVAVAAAAGLLASVVPARRAARLSPVEGLAVD
ncbi:ABC transporter permease [Arthrobacter sp. SDTb3-6]|uniref:ABC transporter permease n=1 Tax=Arthrobacter sp. SDTb3-6 TaxID=2713571 RepID=UPI00159DE173|nr:FtsX family ABC transporter permease [Arthrobacter sp. SDTb3-6]NVM98586.1 ABC transporter permease [Arthrobacter sp. SDTb3-6]